jgi:23S rRNA-/tRNA-specific pseudouridylate synthase
LLGPEAEQRVAEGSVFVDGHRVRDVAVELPDGADVRVGHARDAERCALLGEIAGLVAVEKPPQLPTEPDRVGNASVRAALATELGVDETELHAVSRLDVGVSGVVLFARGAHAKKEAARLRERGEIQRQYCAIAGRAPAPASGRWQQSIEGKSAVTEYRTLAEVDAGPALLALSPVTGRKHQLRIHASAAGVPLLGDRLHGGAVRLVLASGAVIEPPRLSLHAHSVVIGKERITARVPEDLAELWRLLGGRDSDWELVREQALG